jgi:hypothetical protein
MKNLLYVMNALAKVPIDGGKTGKILQTQR